MRMSRLDGITDSMNKGLTKFREVVEDMLQSMEL